MLGKFAHVIALGLVALLAALALLLLFVPVPAVNGKAFDLILTAVVGQVAAVVGYYFGASRGNKEPPAPQSFPAPDSKR